MIEIIPNATARIRKWMLDGLNMIVRKFGWRAIFGDHRNLCGINQANIQNLDTVLKISVKEKMVKEAEIDDFSNEKMNADLES